MLKNSSILSLFGLGLILSTSPLFALMDSSIDEISTVGISNGEEELEEIEEEEEETVEEEEEETEEDQEASEDPTTSEETDVETQASEPTPVALPSTPTSQPESTTSPVSVETPSSSPKIVPESIPKASIPSASPQKTSSSGKGASKTRRKYVKDYNTRVATGSRGVFKVDFKGEEKYLYSIDKDVDFSLPIEEWKKYQKISEENIKISLFKNTAWANKTTNKDEYEELNDGKVKELFNLVENKEKAKLKQLLVSLSNRREWRHHENTDNFNSQPLKAELDEKGKLDLKLKYFLSYEELKEYVVPRAKKCVEKRLRCVALRKDLVIIDQDKKSFFKESKKLEG